MAKESYKIKQKPEDFIVKEVTAIKPGKEGPYSYFLLKKMDLTTMGAVLQIADFLKIPLKHVGFAGTKDKKAITEQYISVKGGYEKRLENFKSKKIELKFLGKGEDPISLGDLKGNEFEIIVRDAKKEPKKLNKFINYFGEQRFSKKNAVIGKEIIKGNFDRAVELIDDPAVNNFLKENKTNYIAALKQMPKKILMLYVHSYQSFMWNSTVEEYLKDKDMKKIQDKVVPLIGFGTYFKNKEIAKIAKRIVKEEKITQREFIIRSMPELSSEGDIRHMISKPKNLKIEKIDSNDYRVRFFLPKGCYATELIRQMFS